MAVITCEVQYPGSTTWDKIDITSGEIEWTKDPSQPASGWIETDWDTPVDQMAGIKIKRVGGICFRGFVKKSSAKPLEEKRKLTVAADPEMLKWRVCPPHIYERDKHCLIHLFQSDAPSGTADAYGISNNIGQLWAASSYVLPRQRTHVGDNIWKIEGGGADSAFYPGLIYVNGCALTPKDSYAAMAADGNSSFYDSDALYYHIDNFPEGWMASVFVDNYAPTYVKMGHIDHPELPLSGNDKLSPKEIPLDELLSVARFHGQYVTYLLEDDATYMDCRVTDGRGYDDGGVFSIKNSDVIDREFLDGDEMPLSGLVGIGLGSAPENLQMYSCQDFRKKNTRRLFSKIDINNGFCDAGGHMQRYVNEVYAARSNTQIKKIIVALDHYARPRDWLDCEWYGADLVQVAGVTMAMKGDLAMDTYDLGYKESLLTEVFDGWDQMGDKWTEEYRSELKSVSDSGTLTISDPGHPSCTPFSMTANLPSSLTSADYNHRVTLDLSFSKPDGMILELGKAYLLIDIGGASTLQRWIPNHVLLDSVSDIDVTDFWTYDSDVSISVAVKKVDDFSGTHSDCTYHAGLNVSGTVKLWRRKKIPAYLS